MRMQNCTLISGRGEIDLVSFGINAPNRIDMVDHVVTPPKQSTLQVTNKQATARLIFFTLYGYSGTAGDIAEILSVLDLMGIE